MKKITLYLNIFLFTIVVLMALNSFSIRGHDLIRRAWAAACSATNMCGSGTPSYLARFTNAQSPVSYTVGDSIIFDNGNANPDLRYVGIGTTAPGVKLDVRGADVNTGAKLAVANSNATEALLLYPGANNDTNAAIAWTTGTNLKLGVMNSGVVDGTGFAEKVRIQSDGNVGIGTTVPGSKLDVINTIRAVSSTQVAPTFGTGLEIFYSSGPDIGYIFPYDRTAAAYKPLELRGSTIALTQGNVGIGTTVPQAKLDVNGAIRLTPIATPTDLVNGMMWMEP